MIAMILMKWVAYSNSANEGMFFLESKLAYISNKHMLVTVFLKSQRIIEKNCHTSVDDGDLANKKGDCIRRAEKGSYSHNEDMEKPKKQKSMQKILCIQKQLSESDRRHNLQGKEGMLVDGKQDDGSFMDRERVVVPCKKTNNDHR